MERLTTEILDPYAKEKHFTLRDCPDQCSRNCFGCKVLTKAIDRLAAYEDTGLEPEEIKELCTDDVVEIAKMFRQMIESGEIDHLRELLQAEKDGRVVVLQEGVTVCGLQEEYCKAKRMADEQLPSPDYTTGLIAGFGAGVIHILDKILTREEAEAALSAEKGDVPC